MLSIRPPKFPASPAEIRRLNREDVLGLFAQSINVSSSVVECDATFKKAFLINHPKAAKQVLIDEAEHFYKGKVYDIFRDFAGDSIFSTNDSCLWHKERKVMAPAFHAKAVEQMADIAVHKGIDFINRVKEKKVISISQEMPRLVIEIISQAFYGVNFSTTDTNKIIAAFDYFSYFTSKKTRSLMQFFCPYNGKRFKQHSVFSLDFAAKLLREHKPTEHTNLLDMLIQSHTANTGEELSYERIKCNTLTALLAGFDTTAKTLMWVFIMLSKNPAVRRKLQQELREVLNGRLPTYNDIRNLPYTRSVIQETLRLYPAAYAITRCNIKELLIDGYTIPKKSPVIVNVYMLHRHPEFWENPEGFDPERFLNHGLKDKHCYMPFGEGPRFCIGSAFATAEMELLVATIMQQLEFDVLPGQTITLLPQFTLGIKENIQCSVKTIGQI